MPLSLNDRWTNIVSNCSVDLTKPVNFLDMADITRYGGKETRLLSNISTEERLPQILREHGCFILPLSFKKVAIVRGKGYHSLEQISSPVEIHKTTRMFPDSLKSAQGETGFLDYAYFTNLVGRFTQTDRLMHGFAGKRRVSFNFHVDGSPVLEARGAQIEVDRSFEGERDFFLVEAKYRMPNSFNLRQLYYPFKHFYSEIGSKKAVRTVFFVYEPISEEYRFWEYSFEDPDDLEQICLTRSKRYRIHFTSEREPLKKYEVGPSHHMRAIQANDVFKLMDIPLAIKDGVVDSTSLSIHLGFDVRQSAYYSDAMRTLGFIIDKDNRYVLTGLGERYVSMNTEERTTYFLKKLAEYPPVNDVLHSLLIGESVGQRELENIVKKHDPTISGTTVSRRAQCIRSWFRFIADMTGYCIMKGNRILPLELRDSLRRY